MNESKDNDYKLSLAEALDKIKSREGKNFSNEKVNLAELERLTGITRSKLRRLKANGFKEIPHGNKGKTATETILSGYNGVIDNLLRNNVSNSQVCFEQIQKLGYEGSWSSVRSYIARHRNLIPAKRQVASPQGNRGRRYSTEPGECYQMDWGFVDAIDELGNKNRAACFAMNCHHCGQCYIEFFPNAKQENLFIGMIHAFKYMGIPKKVLTDNMKSVVIKRGPDEQPIWNHDYENFMKIIGFETRLCKPYHPFTKGRVERLVQFVKSNFIAGRKFMNVTDLNEQALDWCNRQNSTYHKASDMVPNSEHSAECLTVAVPLERSPDLFPYLCPERKISFDGFVNYEGRRFGVPFTYAGRIVRVCRSGHDLLIYSDDLKQKLTVHPVTWSRKDSFCADQYAKIEQPEEFPTMPVKATIRQLVDSITDDYFDQFDFSEGDDDE